MDKQFNFLMYQAAEEEISVNALIKDDSVWLTQKPWVNCLVLKAIQ